MKRFLEVIYKTDLTFHVISGIVLALMMAITLIDVLARNLGHPIVGAMEIISFGGSVVVGFAIPYASWKRVHVYVDLLVNKLGPRKKMVLNAVTRCMGMALFVFIGVNFIVYGLDLIRTGEVSASFRLPYYPIAFGLSLSCFLQSLTLFADLLRTLQGGAHE
ncbi:MAG: TRAP transporter small permease [Desulfobacterota bacterium]|jgi:TRAP-type C4-dicarboxylate transport system permease small subunit|nr:TRAP transporter small permease [Thermodesulfobacteriota bacterium]